MKLSSVLGTVAFALGLIALFAALRSRTPLRQLRNYRLAAGAIILGTLHNVISLPPILDNALSLGALILAIALFYQVFPVKHS